MRFSHLSMFAALSLIGCSDPGTTGTNEAMMPANASGAARTGPYPTGAVLAAFRAACGDVKSFEDAERGVARLGWEEVQHPERTPLARFMEYLKSSDYAKSLSAQQVEDAGMSLREKDVSGEQLYLLISALRSAQGSITGCRLIDPDETRGISVADVANFLGRQPTETGVDETGSAASWVPGFSVNQPRLELVEVNPGSQAAAQMGASGFAIRTNQRQR